MTAALRIFRQIRRLYRFAIAVILSAGLLGCTYKPLAGSSIGFKLSPSLRREAQAAGEANLYVQGWLERDWELRDAPLFVVALGLSEDEPEVVAVMPVGSAGSYGLYLPAAKYKLIAFVDKNSDALLQASEIVGERRELVTLYADGPSAQFDMDLIVPGKAPPNVEKLLQENIDLGDLTEPNLAVARDLTDARFAPEEGTLGLINPNAFLQKHPLVQFVREPDFTDERPVVVMVHGIDGTPSVFAKLTADMGNRFQSWYFYYPSGARLPESAEVLNHLFFSGQFLPRMPRAALVAHSMGGLVSRAALNRHKALKEQAPYAPTPVPLYVSFVTPYGGVEEANIGIRTSPFRVPSWIDVASGSEFQKELFAPLEDGTTFHLISGNSEKKSDGTILLSSQQAPLAVKQAASVSTFPQSHVGIMSDPKALASCIERLKSLTASAEYERTKGDPLLSDEERVRRAKVVFSYLHNVLSERSIPFSVMRVTRTAARFKIGAPEGRSTLLLAVGEGLRAEFPESKREGLWEKWQEPDEGEVTGFYRELLLALDQETAKVPTRAKPAPVVAQALPPAPNWLTPYPPPVHLFAGLSGRLNLGEQYLSLRVPVEFSMYFGRFGFGTDVRLPLLSPVIRADERDVTYHPFGFGLGPRMRFGHKHSTLSATLGANFAAEVGSAQMTASESGRPGPRNDALEREFAGAVGGYGSAHVGFRITQDFYLRTGADFGSLFSSVRAQAGSQELILLEPIFLNLLLGAEIRIP